MFKEARIKLTIWYVVVTMLISVFFSFSIYVRVINDLDRGYRRLSVVYHERGGPFGFFDEAVASEQFEHSRRNILITLLLINSGILVLTGTAGYFLAGRALKPIQNMLEEQKRFISDASHELRTPLTSLKTSIEVGLRNKHLDVPQSRELLRDNLEEVNSMQVLTDDLLVLSRPSATNGKISRENMSLDLAVEESIKKVAALAQKKDIKILYAPTDISAGISIPADEKSITQVFVILLDNAIKYSKMGTQVQVIAAQLPGSVSVKFKDHGIGINPEELLHIFDRFYRVDQSRSAEVVDGFGLGLPIAKKIIEEHGGKIVAESSPQSGTVFTVTLPLNSK